VVYTYVRTHASPCGCVAAACGSWTTLRKHGVCASRGFRRFLEIVVDLSRLGRKSVDTVSSLSHFNRYRIVDGLDVVKKLTKFLQEHGGCVPTSALKPLYEEFPYMRGLVGTLAEFCSSHPLLTLRSAAQGVKVLSLALPLHEEGVHGEGDADEKLPACKEREVFWSKARQKWRHLPSHPHRTAKRHDGHQLCRPVWVVTGWVLGSVSMGSSSWGLSTVGFQRRRRDFKSRNGM